MLRFKTYACTKCGKQFQKAVGGVVLSPKEMELELCPVCDACKLERVASIFKF